MSTDSSTDLPSRHRPAHLPLFDRGNRASIVLLTVCTRDRRAILATPDMHDSVVGAWKQATHWLVGRYVVMPDHVHLFCAPNSYPSHPLASWVSYWKRLTSFGQGAAIWQKNFWDTQLRHHENYAAKWDYVRNNPVRAGLTKHADAWPYQGELNTLRWHD